MRGLVVPAVPGFGGRRPSVPHYHVTWVVLLVGSIVRVEWGMWELSVNSVRLGAAWGEGRGHEGHESLLVGLDYVMMYIGTETLVSCTGTSSLGMGLRDFVIICTYTVKWCAIFGGVSFPLGGKEKRWSLVSQSQSCEEWGF